MRSGDPDSSFSRGNCVPSERCGWVGRRFLRGVLHLGRNVGGFIGHSRGVDKIDEVFMHRSGVSVSPDSVSLAP